MRNVKNKLAVYKKMYGYELPTAEKLENAGAVTGILTIAYNMGISDAETHNDRLAELEKFIVNEYNTPGEFQNWLVDSVKKAYQTGYEERSKEK